MPFNFCNSLSTTEVNHIRGFDVPTVLRGDKHVQYSKNGSPCRAVRRRGRPVFAADLAEPPVVEEAPPPVAYEQPADFGGWYIRGDIDYHWSRFGGGDYVTYGPTAPQIPGHFDSGKLKGAFSAAPVSVIRSTGTSAPI